MIAKLSFFIGIFAVSFLISSASKLSPPSNYSGPANSDKLCFAARFDFAINVQYLKKDGSNATVRIPLNESTYETYSVNCENSTTHELTIFMLKSLTAFFFRFTADGNGTAALTHIGGFVTINDLGNFFPDVSPDAQGIFHFASNETEFAASRNKSFECNSKTTIGGFPTNSNGSLQSIEFENLRIQSFANETQKFDGYADAEVCSADADKESNLVPIIVGACLAVLVVIVLIAYMIGRRRSRNGYQSV